MQILSLPPATALRLALIAAAMFVGYVVLTFAFKYLSLDWSWYAVLVGGFLGVFVGYILIVAVPYKVQLVGVGSLLGLGADWVSASLKPGGGTALLGALASFISDQHGAINKALQQTGLSPLSDVPVTIGLWAFVIMVAVLMAFGTTEQPT
jgi:hypothetical protein